VPALERILLTHPDGAVTRIPDLSIDDLAPGFYGLSILSIDGRSAAAQSIEARAGRSPGEAILELTESARVTVTGPGEYSLWSNTACVAQGKLQAGESLVEPVPPGDVRLSTTTEGSTPIQWTLQAGQKQEASLAEPGQ
jgi:hypothetical protein